MKCDRCNADVVQFKEGNETSPILDAQPIMKTMDEWAPMGGTVQGFDEQRTYRVHQCPAPKSPAKGIVEWCGSGIRYAIACQITLDEAKALVCVDPKPPVAPPVGGSGFLWSPVMDVQCQANRDRAESRMREQAKDAEIARLTDEVASLKQHNATTLRGAFGDMIRYRDMAQSLAPEVARLRGALERIAATPLPSIENIVKNALRGDK